MCVFLLLYGKDRHFRGYFNTIYFALEVTDGVTTDYCIFRNGHLCVPVEIQGEIHPSPCPPHFPQVMGLAGEKREGVAILIHA